MREKVPFFWKQRGGRALKAGGRLDARHTRQVMSLSARNEGRRPHLRTHNPTIGISGLAQATSSQRACSPNRPLSTAMALSPVGTE